MNEAAVLRATMTDSGTFTRQVWKGAGWGTRTPGQYSSGAYADFFCKINVSGEWYEAINNPVYVRPCLVLPDDTLVDNSSRITVGVETPVKVSGTWRAGVSWSKIGGVWRKTEAIHKKVDGSWKQ